MRRSWLQPSCYSPAIRAAEQQVTALPSLPVYEEADAEPPTTWDGDPQQHDAADATAAPPPTEDMTPCVLDMFPVAINARLAWVPLPKEPPRVVVRCTPPPESGPPSGTTNALFIPTFEEPPRFVLRCTRPPRSCFHNGTATAPLVTPTAQVHRQTTPTSSASTHSEEPPPSQSTSEECENESQTEFPCDSPFATVNVFHTLRVRDTPRRRPIRATCEHVSASTPREDVPPADFTTIAHRPHRSCPSIVRRPPVPAVCRRRRRLGTRKHPRIYGRKKGSQFCRSQPTSAHEVRQYSDIPPPTFNWGSRPLSMNNLCFSTASTDSASGATTSRSSASHNDRLPGKFRNTSTSSRESESPHLVKHKSHPSHTTVSDDLEWLEDDRDPANLDAHLYHSTKDLDWLHTDEPNSQVPKYSALHGNSCEPFHACSVCFLNHVNTFRVLVCSFYAT